MQHHSPPEIEARSDARDVLRGQPELVCRDMDCWAAYLRGPADARGRAGRDTRRPLPGGGAALATRVEGILVAEFKKRGFDPKAAPMYSQMLVGMIGTTGQWWLDTRRPSKQVVVANVVNLAWNGLHGLQKKPTAPPK